MDHHLISHGPLRAPHLILIEHKSRQIVFCIIIHDVALQIPVPDTDLFITVPADIIVSIALVLFVEMS